MTMPHNPALSMRPMLPEDAPVLAEIFRASIQELCAEDYSDAQIEAWIETAEDEEKFAKMLGGQLTLIAMLDGVPVGFASMKGNDHLDMLYVHPAAVRQGAASMLVDALERLAQARGAKKIRVDASDTAEEFFKKRGYAPQSRNTITRGDEWLASTTMEKPLGERQPLQ